MGFMNGGLCRLIGAAVVAVALFFPHPGHTAEDVSYSIGQSWFKPSLTVNNDPKLCEILLDGYINYFVRRGDINPLEADFAGERFREGKQPSGTGSVKILAKSLKEVEWKSVQLENAVSGYYNDFRIAETTLNGQYFAVVRKYSSQGIEEVSEDIFRTTPILNNDVPFQADDLHQSFGKKIFNKLVFNEQENVFDVIYRDDPRFENYESQTFVKITNIYQSNGATYLLLIASNQPDTYMLVRLIDPKKLALTCSLQTVPQQSHIDQQQKQLEEFKALESDLITMIGEEGNCGTLHALSRAKHSLTSALNELLYHPWNIPPGDWKLRKNSVDSSLFVWGHSGIWNYHVYKRYESDLPKAEKRLAQFYRKNFSLSENAAHELAERALAHAIVSGFDHGSANDEMGYLHEILLTGANTTELESEHVTTETDQRGQESLLTFAIGHSELVKALLDMGLDPNRQNAFGKTPLMYAAQFNDVESAKILLEKGAFTEGTTIDSDDSCTYTIGIKNVSALHYAVRYSSREFIELLLNHDAPIYIKDSKGRTPFDYLMIYGDVGYGASPPIEGELPEKNENLTADDSKWLQKVLKPPEEGEKNRLSNKINLQAEQFYRQGKLQDAYASLKRAIALDPHNERARANQSLIALKLGRLGESAQLSTVLIASAQSKAAKANAYFNLGLACRQKEMSGNNYTIIDYDGERFCDNDVYLSQGKRADHSAFSSFLSAYLLQPTPDRLSAILRYFEESDTANKKQLLNLSDTDSGAKSLIFYGKNWFFLVDADKEVSFKRLTIFVNNTDKELVFERKEVIPLSTTQKLEHWIVSPSTYYGNWNFPLKLDDSIYNKTCSFVFGADTKLVEIVSPKKRYGLNSRKNTVDVHTLSSPRLLVLYGNRVEWTLEGDLSNIVGLYVHGQSTISLSSGKTVPIYYDNEKVDFDPKDTSFNRYTVSKIGLAVDSIITVDESGKAVVTD